MTMKKYLLTAVVVVASAGCAPSNTSIVVSYPSAGAKEATKLIEIYAFGQEEAAARSRCRDFTTKLPGGERLGENPVDDPFALVGEKQLTNFPSGDPVIVVVALNDADPMRAKPILQGCTDTYGGDDGYTDVPVALDVIIPARTAISVVGGDRQVGGLGSTLGEPLRVRVDTAFDMATQRERYPLPAVPVTFTLMAGGEALVLGDGAPGAPFEGLTDANGEVALPVKLPSFPGTFSIKVTSPPVAEACQAGLENRNPSTCRAPSERTIIVSSVSVESSLRATNVIRLDPFERAVGVAVGNVVGSADVDAVVLGCRGDERGCQPGRCAGYEPLCTGPECTLEALTCRRPDGVTRPGTPGQTSLAVISDVAGSPMVSTPAGDLGIVPGGVLVGPLAPSSHDDIALVNGRRADCQNRGCESSEMLVYSGGANGVSLIARETLTASNAVALVGVRRAGEAAFSTLLTAAQGRSVLGRPCSRASLCLFEERFICAASAGLTAEECSIYCNDTTRPVDRTICIDECLTKPEECGCPSQERCECIDADGCPNATQPGRCVPQDKFIDRLANDFVAANPRDGFSNKLGCQQRALRCVKNGDTVRATCECLDEAQRGNPCSAEDGCGCSIPTQISVGDQAGVIAHDIAVGKLQPIQGIDMVVGSEGGVDFMPRTSEANEFRWSIRKTPMAVVHFVRTARLDPDEIDDIIWLAKGPCDEFNSVAEPCPLVRRPVGGLIDGSAPSGCMGVYVRRNNTQIDTTAEGGCRRFHLPVRPDGVCTGDVNGDGKQDVIVSGFARASALVYLGDNSGGLLDPPLNVPMPSAGGGGVLACGDLDGDQLTDVVTVSKSGVVSVLRTGP